MTSSKIEPAPCFPVGDAARACVVGWLGMAHGHDEATFENLYWCRGEWT